MPPTPGRPRPRRPVRRGRRTAGVLSLLVLAAGGLGHAAVNGVNGAIGRVDAFGGVQGRPAASMGTNYLLVGTDGRDGLDPAEKRRYHLGGVPCHCTDTIMLVHISRDRRRVTVVSIPRDTYVRLPGRARRAPVARTVPARRPLVDLPRSDAPPAPAVPGPAVYATHPAKINEAYADGGPKLTVRTVEQLTGVRIDHYVEVDFVSFMKTVDVLGGVRVCTTVPLKDSYSGLDLPAGTSTLDGARALQYVRSRHVDGAADLGRMRRQQDFLAEVMRRIASGDTLRDPVVLDGVARTVLGSVRTDQGLRPADLIALAEGMRGFSPRSSQFTQVPLSAVGYLVPGVGSTVKWDERAAGRLWAAIRADRPLAAGAARGQDGAGSGRERGPDPSQDTDRNQDTSRSRDTSRAGATRGKDANPGPGATRGKDAPRGKDAHGTTVVEVDPRMIRVDVENGTTTNGLAATAQKELAATGFATPAAPGTAPLRVSRTVIRYDPRWYRSAKSLAAALPGARLLAVRGHGPVLQVFLGPDFTKVTPVAAAPPPPTGTGGRTGSAGGGAVAGAGPATGGPVTCP